jgi:hypothetical protein
MRRHFAASEQVEEPDLRQFIWNPSEKTGILIEMVYRWRGDVVELRPAILVARNAYQSQRVSLQDLAGEDEREGTRNFTLLWIGSHTLFCIQYTGSSVELLANEVRRELTQFSQVIRESLGLTKFQVIEGGGVNEVEESKEHFVVPVTVGWAYQENWRLRPESLAMRRFPLSLLLGMEPFEMAAGVTLP